MNGNIAILWIVEEHWSLGIHTNRVTEIPFMIHLTYKFYSYNTDTETPSCMDTESPRRPRYQYYGYRDPNVLMLAALASLNAYIT